MQVDVVQALVQAGAIGIVLALLAWLVRPLLKALTDNLDKMSQGYVGYVEAQVQVATAMRDLCQKLDEAEGRDAAQDALLNGLAERMEEMVATQRGMQQQMQSHEGRAAKRHEQYVSQSEKQLALAEQMLKAFQSLNGKAKG